MQSPKTERPETGDVAGCDDDEGRWERYLDAGVSVSVETVRTGLHDLAIKAALIQGEESGSATPFDFDAFIAQKRAAYRS
jgi:Arc/MetJ-type ribon-helix-helix transcriptional regulator